METDSSNTTKSAAELFTNLNFTIEGNHDPVMKLDCDKMTSYIHGKIYKQANKNLEQYYNSDLIPHFPLLTPSACSAALCLVKSLQNERSKMSYDQLHICESTNKAHGLSPSSGDYCQQSSMNPKIVSDEVDAGEQIITWSTDLRPIVAIGHINRIPASLIVSPSNVESSVDTAILVDFEPVKVSDDQPEIVDETTTLEVIVDVTCTLTEERSEKRTPAEDCGSLTFESKEIVFDAGVRQTSELGSTEAISKSKKKRLKAKKRAAQGLDSLESGAAIALNDSSAPSEESETASSSCIADSSTASHELVNEIMIDHPGSASRESSLLSLVSISEGNMGSTLATKERSAVAVNFEEAEHQGDENLQPISMSITASSAPSSGSAGVLSSLDIISATVSANPGITSLAILSAPIIDKIAATVVAEVFSPPVSKTMRKKLNARKRSAELAESLSVSNAKKAKLVDNDGNDLHVENKLDIVLMAPASNGAVTIVEATISDEKSSGSGVPVASNLITQLPDTGSAIAAIKVPSTTTASGAAVTTGAATVSKGVRKRLKARVKAEEALALNPEGAELTALLKAALINKAAQANHAKQKLETLTAKTTKYLPPSMRVEGIPQPTPSCDAPPSSSAINRPLSKYGPRLNSDPYVRNTNSPTETPKPFNKYSHLMQTTPHTSATAYQVPQQYQLYNDLPVSGSGQTQSSQLASSAASWGVPLSSASQSQLKIDPSTYGNSERQPQLSSSYGNQVHSHGQAHAIDQNSYQPIQNPCQGSHYPLSSSGLSNYNDASSNTQYRSADPAPSANYQQQQYAQYAPSMTNGHIYSPTILSTAHQYSPSSSSAHQYAPGVGVSYQQYAQLNSSMQQFIPAASAPAYAIQYDTSSPASPYNQPLQQHSYQQQQRSYQNQTANQPQHLLALSEYSIASSSLASSHMDGAQTSYGLGTAYSYVSPSVLGIQNQTQNHGYDNGGNTANYLPPTSSMKAGYQRSAS
jgi:hypothetical protein